jgi:hypothetical protein
MTLDSKGCYGDCYAARSAKIYGFNFGVSINGLKVQFIPSSSKDLDNLEGTDVKEELQKWLDHKFGKEMMLPDFQFEGAGYGFIISDKLIDSAIGKYLKA